MPSHDHDPWSDAFRRRTEASERRFYERLRQQDRRFVIYLIAVAACWLSVPVAIKLLW